MTTTDRQDPRTEARTAACGECWTYDDEHLPSCSAAAPSTEAPAVLMFDRAGREQAEWDHANRSIDAGEFSDAEHPMHGALWLGDTQ